MPPPQQAFSEWKNIWSAISAVLLSSTNAVESNVVWFATHATTAGKPTPAANRAMYTTQQALELGVTKKEACLGTQGRWLLHLTGLHSEECWRMKWPQIQHSSLWRSVETLSAAQRSLRSSTMDTLNATWRCTTWLMHRLILSVQPSPQAHRLGATFSWQVVQHG